MDYTQNVFEKAKNMKKNKLDFDFVLNFNNP